MRQHFCAKIWWGFSTAWKIGPRSADIFTYAKRRQVLWHSDISSWMMGSVWSPSRHTCFPVVETEGLLLYQGSWESCTIDRKSERQVEEAAIVHTLLAVRPELSSSSRYFFTPFLPVAICSHETVAICSMLFMSTYTGEARFLNDARYAKEAVPLSCKEHREAERYDRMNISTSLRPRLVY